MSEELSDDACKSYCALLDAEVIDWFITNPNTKHNLRYAVVCSSECTDSLCTCNSNWESSSRPTIAEAMRAYIDARVMVAATKVTP